MRAGMIAAALSLLPHAALMLTSPIHTDEAIVFFTTAARSDGTGWIVPVHAWVFEPERDSLIRQLALSSLAKALELDDTAAASNVFRDRASWFLVDNERDKEIKISLAEQPIGSTQSNGHAQGEVRLKRSGVSSESSVSFIAKLPNGDKRIFQGEALLVPPVGLSVISDIDDTIKLSEVTDKKKVLENTFVKPFEAAPGMAAAYQRLADAGAVFHYVSSSPWQLYPALSEFMKSVKYPLGSMHLRLFRVKDESVFNLLKSSEETKPPVINRLLADYPRREFIFIGDSGEKDPEIYGKIARENPGRVRHIYIRRVTPEMPDDVRYRSAFNGVHSSQWTVFDDPSVIGKNPRAKPIE